MKPALATLLLCLLAATATSAADDHEFFEQKIRPVLAHHCYECHNSSNAKKGGLALDWRDALLAGGDSGAVVVPGKPKESILIWALRHEEGYEMPSNSPKLPAAVIRDFEKWVSLGTRDPRLKPPTAAELAQKLPWEEVREQRRAWWAFQPVYKQLVPKFARGDKHAQEWVNSSIDRFVYHRMSAVGLKPQPVAPPAVLVRRLHLILTGLPPTPEVTAAFVADPSPEAYQQLVDELLASDAFGERWARHWMDWYRYAESHGSEGDPPIPYVAAYRDYLVRALNADVPYDQLIREHLAGDLLPNPRINQELQLNESAIGPAHLRMVPHGFGVTDAYGEQITFTDNQIDVLSKAMLGVTVSCARCHDHKFDPISQKDFYRFYGVLIGSRPSTVLIDAPEKLARNKAEIATLKAELRREFAELWLAELEQLPARLAEVKLDDSHRSVTHPLALWGGLKGAEEKAYAGVVARAQQQLQEIRDHNAAAIAAAEFYVDLRDPAHREKWFSSGNSTADAVSPAGSFALHATGDRAIVGIYPRGIYSHLISDKHAAVFSSANFTASGERTLVRVAGSDAELRVPIRNYPLTHGGLHPATGINNHATLSWQPTQKKWRYWQGEQIHYELRTSRDIIPRAGKSDRSWFGVTEIFAGDQPPKDLGASLLAVIDEPQAITNRETLLAAYARGLRQAITHWRDGKMNDAEAEFLDQFVRLELLTQRVAELPPALQAKVDQYRKLEAEIPLPTRAPGVLDVEPVDQPLLVRGEYKQPGDPVQRQFLEIFADAPYTNDRPSRLQLAEDMVGLGNTLTARVLVNRLWAYVFGRGIVASTDNFGRLGSEPSHPELLDQLTLDFQQHGWSIKHTLRELVTSRAFQSSSFAPDAVREADAKNVYLSYFTPRRLDAEAIYDSLMTLSGKDERAVYLPVVRNRLHPFLQAFNAPVPTSTVSYRTNTNVPAQSLAMLNGEIASGAARGWANRIQRNPELVTAEQQISAMFVEAFARPPQQAELQVLLAYLNGEDNDSGQQQLQTAEANYEQARNALHTVQKKRDALLAPVRQRLQAELERKAADSKQAAKPIDLKPIASWDFDGDARDSVGPLHGKLIGKAEIADGALVLSGGYLATAALQKPLATKTLEVLVRLDGLEQRGGGAMTVQTTDGQIFDSIVFAEARERRWLAGSDHFRRTEPLAGAAEEEAANRPVRISIVYDSDGTIRVYRDGQPYAPPYRKAALHEYPGGRTQVVFGLRHGTGPGGNRILTGKIYEARLYDRALTTDEIAASVSGTQMPRVTRKLLLAALTAEQQQQLKKYDEQLAAQTEQLAELETQLQALRAQLQSRPRGLEAIAHALLNTKELIYVR